jgi:nicotinate-nucleotide pyrophosphorylase (carboxylating)
MTGLALGAVQRKHAATLEAAGLDPAEVEGVVRRALEEDLALGPDVTTDSTVPVRSQAIGDIVPRSPGMLAGVPVAAAVFDLVGRGGIEVDLLAADGTAARPGEAVLTVAGPARALLTAERSALNLIGHLSGIATLTRHWVDAVAGTAAAIRDTRKTTPGLRALEKYAVRCGGGVNHRMSLSDEALVKDNHVLAAGGVAPAFRRVRERFPGVPVQVEVTTLEQLEEVVAAGAESILLDNMPTETMRAAVRAVAGRATVEASGGLTLDQAREVGETGVDFLAVGALTHSAPVLDIAFDLRAGEGPNR